ncbi:MAG: DUF5615 family PIN-like protein [Chthonomonadales bacterium]
MKFLVDAQLPRRVANIFRIAGHDVVHTLDLPDRNRTTDAQILVIAGREDRIVVTKDADFVNSYLLNRQPRKLLLISTGNISNSDLESLLKPNTSAIAEAFDSAGMIELTRTALIIHS